MKNINRLHRLSARIEEHLSQFEEIDLKGDGSSGLCCGDYGSRGPTLYVSGRKDSKVYDMPKSGKAKVSYRVRSKGVDYRGEDGEESYRTEIEVESIEPVDLEAVVDSYNFGDRARDAGGRYAPGQNVSADEMADAYVKPKKKKAALLAGAGVAGVTAAVAGRSPAISQGVGRLLRSAV